MRKYYKTILSDSFRGIKFLSIDRTFEDHVRAMGDYDPNDSYANKERFFARYVPRGGGVHDCFDQFLMRHLKKNQDVLSVASGRAANELHFIDQGYQITCSDMQLPNSYPQTKVLFPQLRYIVLNILDNDIPKQYDAIICLGLTYLFNDNDFDRFFENVRRNLKIGGSLILGTSGCAPNTLSFILHNLFLPLEGLLILFYRTLFTKKKSGLAIKHHGYLRSDDEIMQRAKKQGLTCCDRSSDGFLMEFKRSVVLTKIMKNFPIFENYFTRLGGQIPYVRMFEFQKTA